MFATRIVQVSSLLLLSTSTLMGQGFGLITTMPMKSLPPAEALVGTPPNFTPAPVMLQFMKIAPSLDIKSGNGVSPSIDLYGEDCNWFRDSKKAYWQYTVGLTFQSKMAANSATELSDEFKLQGGDGNFSISGAFNYQFSDYYQIKIAAIGKYAWVSINETAPSTNLSNVSNEVIQYGASIGFWLKWFYIGGEYMHNSSSQSNTSDFSKLINNQNTKKIRVLIPIANDYYASIQKTDKNTQVSFTKKLSFF